MRPGGAARAPAGGVSLRRAGIELLAVSFVVLFQELALIRWLPGQVRVVAYFPNLVLVAAFLGLGIGSLRARNRSLLALWPLGLLAVAGTGVALRGVAFTAEGDSEFLWLLYNDLPPGAPVVPSVRLPIVLLFVLSAASFVPLGQVVARRLSVFRERSSALWGYALDLTGSLVGVVAFAVASFVGSFPVVWFAVVAAAGSVVLARRPKVLAPYGAAMAVLLVLVGGSERAEAYSPYYALSTVPADGEGAGGEFTVRTNGSLHQIAFDTDGTAGAAAWQAPVRAGYHMPYRLLDRPPNRVLVLGAGTGNDVAVALRQGATEVDAVEIDPEIVELGRRRHPNRPYDDPRVTVHRTDARSFLNDADGPYDLVVFGTLDSMTRLSALSTVRLDNFVYTRDGIGAASRLLAPGGGMLLYFRVADQYIFDHLTLMLTDAFGELPATRIGDWQLFNAVFMAGPAFDHLPRPPVPASIRSGLAEATFPTDDWPYLYLPEPRVGTFYLSLMAIFLALAVGAVAVASPQVRRGLAGRGADGEMFLYGMAFLLLETRFVTEMNLVWGATWLTSAVVFGAILLTILVSTVVMELRPLRWGVAATGLVAALAATWLVPTDALLARDVAPRLALSVLFVGAPVFFAAACFALRFRERAAVDVAFGWNLLGAVAGGLLEFFSMALGLKAMVLVAVLAYLGAFLLKGRAAAGTAPAVPSEPVPVA